MKNIYIRRRRQFVALKKGLKRGLQSTSSCAKKIVELRTKTSISDKSMVLKEEYISKDCKLHAFVFMILS
jgi:hypothetical protein